MRARWYHDFEYCSGLQKLRKLNDTFQHPLNVGFLFLLSTAKPSTVPPNSRARTATSLTHSLAQVALVCSFGDAFSTTVTQIHSYLWCQNCVREKSRRCRASTVRTLCKHREHTPGVICRRRDNYTNLWKLMLPKLRPTSVRGHP